jgi:hypothetical protein
MPLPLIAAALPAVINGITSIAGMSSADKQREREKQLWDDYLSRAQGQTSLDVNKALGFLGLTDKSAYSDMDPRAKGMSMEALTQLINRGKGTGLDTQSRVALQQAMGQTGAAASAARQGVFRDYQQMGQAGSASQLGAALQGNQAVYGELASASGQASASAEQRRLEANVLASRAGQQQQQLEQQQAAAYDALKRFNVGARQNTLQQQIDAMRNLNPQGAADSANRSGQQSQNAWANMGNVTGGLLGKGMALWDKSNRTPGAPAYDEKNDW